METITFGNPAAGTVLLQPADAQDLAGMEREFSALCDRTDVPFLLTAVRISDWNRALSPWRAPAVFGSEPFGDAAAKTLEQLLPLCADRNKTYYLGGYSLAGLFSLWAAYQTDTFSGVAAASPSLWFPGFAEYMENHTIRTRAVSLSLGDKEEKTRNPVMRTVGDRVREAAALLHRQGVPCALEWNQGNHFREPDLRTAKAFAWLINNPGLIRNQQIESGCAAIATSAFVYANAVPEGQIGRR